MFRASYLETVEDAGPAARARDAHLFELVIERIEAIGALPPDDRTRLEGLRLVQEFWRYLIADLSDDANALPLELRADLVSIGLWAIREADALIAGRKEDVDALREVHATIRDGLVAETA